jgi:acetolactate synthase-1/2/3 large subunit
MSPPKPPRSTRSISREVEVIGDIANAIWQMKEVIEPNPAWNFDFMLKARAAEVAHTGCPLADDARFPIYPPHLVQQVRAMPCRMMASSAWTMACTRSGSRAAIRLSCQHRAARQCAGDHGGGPALGDDGAMIYPDRKVMAICGDGGFMMNSQEMETAVRLKLNLTVLILNDNSLWHDPLEAGEYGLQGLGADLWQPRFREICRGLWRTWLSRDERRI